MKKHIHFLSLLLIFSLLPACGSFFSKPQPGKTQLQPVFARAPFDEYWVGISFNEAKIGFSHMKISGPGKNGNRLTIESRASLAFHFLMYDKRLALSTHDTVHPDLTIDTFSYSLDTAFHFKRHTGGIFPDEQPERLLQPGRRPA